MNCMKLTRLAVAGAALLLSAAITAPASAAPIGAATAQSATGQADGSLIEVRRYRHGGYRHHRRYGHRHGGFRFFFAPVIVGGGYYGYDRYRDGYRGRSCYSICRDYRGPDYCRYNWRRYC